MKAKTPEEVLGRAGLPSLAGAVTTCTKSARQLRVDFKNCAKDSMLSACATPTAKQKAAVMVRRIEILILRV
jgi:hypothetical protein